VNCIAPGFMLTNLTKSEEEAFSESSEEEHAQYGRMNPMPIPVVPEHIANAALFLASDMSAAVTGVALPVDCGFTAK
jgi:glucose 1-dehydrogenase